MRRRVELGVELTKAGVAPLLVLSGGNPVDGVAEAVAMRDLALAAEVPEAALLCETRSRNTAQNALNTAALLREHGVTRIVLVTHRTHLFRARLVFRLAGLTVSGTAGIPARSWVGAVAATVCELVALPRSVFLLLPAIARRLAVLR